ncbi:hypothetical protein BgAZ_105790 [Babesia gibsoni]|uniref:Uncharacterized protein n=1 Tax=Babesia gibsoni TaxID=33632 RepID=A0AAD8UVN4_BABGI|nr:hypothetical protein BgAZ_105790 [Babesia gibsoni]
MEFHRTVHTGQEQHTSFEEGDLSDCTATTVDGGNDVGCNIKDFYYVDDLSIKNAAEHLFQRHIEDKPFTYFGNVLFYLMPPKRRDIQKESATYLYGENDSEPHLCTLINEILHSVGSAQKKTEVRVVKFKKEAPEYVRSITKSCAENLDLSPTHDNYNVFVYGDGTYGQHTVAAHAAVYAAQCANVIGLESSGIMSENVAAVNELMELFNDFSSYGRDVCNLQVTYKLNFGTGNQLDSINIIPNLATDMSCLVVSHVQRVVLQEKKKVPILKGAVLRPPSIFYAFLYSRMHGKYKRWCSGCRISSKDASMLLEMLPPHEVEDADQQIATFDRAVKLMLRIGFSGEEVIHIVQMLAVILLLDLYNILWARGARNDDGPDEDIDEKHGGVSIDEVIKLNPKSVFTFAAEIMDIALLRAPAKSLSSNDLLFKLDILGAKNQARFSFLPSAFFLRIKHLLYRKSNAFLVLKFGSTTATSIAIHCNAGNFPQSLKVDTHGDVEMAKRSAEEVFVHMFIKSIGSIYCGEDFTDRNVDTVNMLMGESGLLAKIAIASQDAQAGTSKTNAWPDERSFLVQHSCQDVTYDLKAVIDNEARVFSVPKDIVRLLKYSKNNFILNLFFSKTALKPTLGPCETSLSYITFLKDFMGCHGNSYYVVCTSPSSARKLYTKHAKRRSVRVHRSSKKNDESQEKAPQLNVCDILEIALNNNMPLLEMCILHRDSSTTSLDLQSAVRTFMPLAYVALPSRLHCMLPAVDAKAAARLLFHALRVPETKYKISGNTLILPKTLSVKLVAGASDYVSRTTNSIRFIQSWWVGYRILQLKKTLRLTLVRMQSRIRCILFQDNIAALSKAHNFSISFIGLCLTIYHLNMTLLSSSHKTLQLLHSMEKRYHEKEFHFIQYAAATYIQSFWRGVVARRKYAKMRHQRFQEFAVMLVQATIRRFLATASIVRKRPERELAATFIQAAYRGYRVRCQYETLCGMKLALLSIIRKGSRLIGLAEQIKFVKERKKHNTVTMQMKKLIIMQTNLPPGFVKAQNLFRMHFVRKQYVHLHSAVEKVQALALTKLARLEYLEKVKAAQVIQNWWRSVHNPDVAKLTGNALYYLNIRESRTVEVLKGLCSSLKVIIFHFNLYHDIRRIYPRSWAMEPIDVLNHLVQVQKSILVDVNDEPLIITGIEFAVGAYHSLMLLRLSNGASSVYTWGKPTALEGRMNNHDVGGNASKQGGNDADNAAPVAKRLDFYKSDVVEGSGAIHPKLSPLPRIEVSSIACGNDFSVALSKCGKVFTWGNNSEGQCGHGHRLVYVWSPTVLRLYGATNVSCGESHSIVRLSVDEYYAFGKIANEVLYTPQDIKSCHEPVRHQKIEGIACGGYLTLLYTTQLNYVLHVIGNFHSFKDLYNLRGTIKAICTNGFAIFALVEQEVENNNGIVSLQQRLYAWGYMRCVSKHFKESLPNTALLVNAFCERFENQEKPEPKRSMLRVDSQLAKSTFVPRPTEVAFYKKVVDIKCDHHQLIIVGKDGVVFGAKVFEIILESSSDIRDSDEYWISINPSATDITLDPALYQFTEMERASGTINVAYNRLASSICYASQ